MKTEEFLLFKKHKRLLKSKKQWSLLRFKKILSWVRIRIRIQYADPEGK